MKELFLLKEKRYYKHTERNAHENSTELIEIKGSSVGGKRGASGAVATYPEDQRSREKGKAASILGEQFGYRKTQVWSTKL